MSEKTHLLPCPFCGSEPSFQGDGSSWVDERRYVSMQLGCCVSMSADVGWGRAHKMTPQQIEAELRERLTAQWNQRSQTEDAEESPSSAEAFEAWCARTENTSYKALAQEAWNAGVAFGAKAQADAEVAPVAPAAERPALTAQLVRAALSLAGYDNEPALARAHFINGIRHGELAHGIFPPGEEDGFPTLVQLREEFERAEKSVSQATGQQEAAAPLEGGATAPDPGDGQGALDTKEASHHAGRQPRSLLSSRLRPGVECAPWVLEEVKKLEAAMRAALSAPEPLELGDDELRKFIPTVQLDKAAPVHMVWMQQKHAFEAIRAALAAFVPTRKP